MHICFLCNEYPKEGFPHGGFGTFVKTIAIQLVKAGVDVSVVGVNYDSSSEEIIESDIAIYRTKKYQTKGLSWFLNARDINRALKKIHQNNPIDIVEASELGLAFINKIEPIKHIIRLHGGHHFFAEAEKRGINKWKGFQEKRSFDKADAFMAVSNYVKIHTEKYLSYNQKEITTINNPIDFSLFNPSKEFKIVPQQIVFAGTVCEKKGVRQLIEAFQIVREEYTNATLLIYGRDWFYPNGDSYINKLHQDFSLEQLKNISFMGSVAHSQLPAIYGSATVCVFPSHIETQGLVAPEAMAMEKIVIFSSTGPGPETIIDGETGFLVDPYNPAEIAKKIMATFEDSNKSIFIGEKARLAAIKKFDSKMILQKNMEFYNRIVK